MSSVPRFFISGNIRAGDTVTLNAEDSYHANKVLRLKKGDSAEVCDGRERVFIAIILSSAKAEVTLALSKEVKEKSESFLQLTLYQGLLKGKKMDTVVQQAVECGVSRIVPLETMRSVALIKDRDHGAEKTERWQKIARSAASQSRRGVVPVVHKPVSLADIIASGITGGGLNVIFWEESKEKSLPLKECKEILSENPVVNIIVGPEGGFDPSEAGLLRRSNNIFIFAGLGPRIMRAETAAVAALILIQAMLGDLQGDQK